MEIIVAIESMLRRKNIIKKKLLQKLVIDVLAKVITLKEKKFNLSVVICAERKIRTLNKLYRNKNSVTDVLSFSDMERGPDGVFYLGEIYLCYPVAKRQASRYCHSVDREIEILLVHGILHLLGFDHQNRKESAEMFEAEYLLLGSESLIHRGNK